jgi:carbon-monoxide dehydrogenase medium subunit
MYDFEFVKPASVAEAVAALAHPEAKALGGGQTFIPTLKQRLASPARVVALAHLAELRGTAAAGGVFTVKAATPHAEVAAAAAGIFPALASLAGHIGDPAVRNRGTAGGSLANNDPAACWPAAVLATGATLVTDRREIAADDWFRGMFETALGDGEILTEIRLPIPERAAYQKFNQPASRFALTGVFVAKYPSGTRVAVTGAGQQGAFRWMEAEAALSASFTPDAVAGLAADPAGLIADIHATAEYRANLIRVLTKRAVAAA